MEQIKIPETFYWQTKTGKLFSNIEDCEKYERLYDKWWKSHREFEGVEGELCYAYWVESKEDIEEILWVAYYMHRASTHLYTSITEYNKPTWLILYPDYDGAETSVRSIDEFLEIVNDTIEAAQETKLELTKLIEEKQIV